jgi:hypothetical protein
MSPLVALLYSFLFGLLHGILPDEHTWPITFSYALGGASGKEGMRAGLYFAAAFTIQRTLVSELAYLALAPFLFGPAVNGIVYTIVGIVMCAAGAIVLRRNRYLHLHLFGHCHGAACEMEQTGGIVTKQHEELQGQVSTPPIRWTVIHGFIAGFGFGGFSLFVNTIAAPAMTSPWTGFLPGLFFGLGTMIMLAVVGGVFGASLRWTRALSESEIRRIGSQTGGRTLFFGGILFVAAGVAALSGLESYLPLASDYAFIALFMIVVAVPALIFSVREVLAARKMSAPKS